GVGRSSCSTAAGSRMPPPAAVYWHAERHSRLSMLRVQRAGVLMSLRSRVRPGAVRSAATIAGLALLATFVIWLVYFAPIQPVSVGTAITGLLGLGIVLVAARYPDRSLIILIVLLPFQSFLL